MEEEMVVAKLSVGALVTNALLAPLAAGAVLTTASPVLAQEPEPWYVIDIICNPRDPSDCWVSQPQLDPDCDGEPG